MLTVAVQKSGRLSEKTLHLLKECGVNFENGGKDKLKTHASNFPLTILFLRDDDIPECVDDKIADVGIVGENVVMEKQKNLVVTERLGFAKCRLSIAVPKTMKYKSSQRLNGLKIATSYPNILKSFLSRNKIDAQIQEINGSVEIAPSIGLADVIFDIVNTGSTLLSNGLKEVETVVNSEAVLVTQTDLVPGKKEILDKFLFRLRSVQKAAAYKYILLNAPNDKLDEICTILPGMKSPTIMPLAMENWSSIHSVIREDDFWENIENLKNEGAQGILVIPIEKMIL